MKQFIVKYRWLVGNLRLWTVTSNDNRVIEVGQVEIGII